MGGTALAQLSNNFVYAALAVYALAMLAYAAEVAASGRVREPEREPAYAGTLATVDRLVDRPVERPVESAPVERPERLGRIALSLTVLAFGLHAAGVLTRALSAGRVPWGNMYEFSITGGLAVTGVFLVLLRRYPIRFLGVVLVPTVLLILGLAVTVLYADSGELVPALRSVWLVIHVSSAVTASGVFSVGAALAALQLVRARAEGRGRPVRGWLGRLPASPRLEALSYRVHCFGFPLWTFALMSGAIWAERAWGRYWGWDPKEVWTFVIWVVYAAYLHARATAGWRGGRAAGVALLGYACLTFNYFGINLLVSGLHSYAF